jgi:hypothetical protein
MTEVPKPTPQVALDFLKAMYPHGPHLLTCIDPNGQKKGIDTQRFSPGDGNRQPEFLMIAHNKGRNIYYSSNPPLDGFNAKASKKRTHCAEPLPSAPLDCNLHKFLVAVDWLRLGHLPEQLEATTAGCYLKVSNRTARGPTRGLLDVRSHRISVFHDTEAQGGCG